MNYQETLAFIYSRLPMFQRLGGQAYKDNLDNTIALCNILGNPQETFHTIHIAGTNGKGSVSHMIASILQEAGYRAGLYTSPHLTDFRERIRVNGKKIHAAYITGFISKYQYVTEQIMPSFFELTVALAFDYFRNQQIDVAVVEVGMGGRLDSTNIIHPSLSIITNVSLDHTQFLGDTAEKIAQEKAGIIKPYIPVVIGETDPLTKEIFRDTAFENHSDIWFADQLFSVENHWLTGKYKNKRLVDVNKGSEYYMNGLICPLTGLYQLKNLMTVLQACDLLPAAGINVTTDHMREGIAKVIQNTGLMGRWQILSQNPLTVCDTGHNEAGIREVIRQVENTPHEHLHFVFGTVNDKDLSPILQLLPKNASYYFCRPDIPRGLDENLLAIKANDAGLAGITYPSVKDALNAAKDAASPDDMILVSGSNFVVAEVL